MELMVRVLGRLQQDAIRYWDMQRVNRNKVYMMTHG
jgi:hypothetical protein